MRVLLDQIASSMVLPLHLPMPTSPTLRRIADLTLAQPGHPRSMLEWSALVGVSVRTLERRFRAETGLSFRSFRRQAKLFKALELLATGATVNDISDRLGFEGPSAFIAMFKAAFGVTPGRYLK
jgi:AraC-like DNA-binding protein